VRVGWSSVRAAGSNKHKKRCRNQEHTAISLKSVKCLLYVLRICTEVETCG